MQTTATTCDAHVLLHPSSVNELPVEILVAIFRFFGAKELFRAAEVCCTWRFLVEDGMTWKCWHRTNFGGNKLPLEPDTPCYTKQRPGQPPYNWKHLVTNDVVQFKRLKTPEEKLQWAAARDYDKLILREVRCMDPNALFWTACYTGALKTLEHLFKLFQFDINAKNSDGWPALSAAAYGGHEKIVKFLLGHGALIEVSDNYGWTPLCWAAYGGHKHVVEYLIQSQASVNHVTNTIETPLSLAEEKGYWEIAAILKSGGAAQIPHEFEE